MNINKKEIKEVAVDPFTWDGTSLGIISENQILAKYNLGTLEYWAITKDKYSTICIVRKCKDYTPCIVDELKPLFGLAKLGTHYARYNSRYYILIRSRMDKEKGYLTPEVFLKEYSNNIELKDKIKNIYVFRDILGIGKSNDDSIILRRSPINDEIFPISLLDKCINVEKLSDLSISTSIPETIFKRWISDDSPSRILCKMFKVHNEAMIVKKLYNLKSKMNIILKRVSDNEYIDLSDILISRISNKLQFHMEKNLKRN